MKVVENEDERLLGREQLEQLSHSSVAAVTLVLERSFGIGRRPGGGRKDGRELDADVVVEVAEAVRLETTKVLVERIDEHPEGKVSLELGCRAGEHQSVSFIRKQRKLGKQTRLADPGLPGQRDQDRTAFEITEGLVEYVKLRPSPDEWLGYVRHPPPSIRLTTRSENQAALESPRAIGHDWVNLGAFSERQRKEAARETRKEPRVSRAVIASPRRPHLLQGCRDCPHRGRARIGHRRSGRRGCR